jgi:hypothetical protein
MYLDLFGCSSGIDSGCGDSGIYVQGPRVSALPLSLALQKAIRGDGDGLIELFRKLEDGDIHESEILMVRSAIVTIIIIIIVI